MKYIVQRGLYILIGIVVTAAVISIGGYFTLKQKWVQERLCVIGIRYFLDNRFARRAFIDKPGLKVILCGTSSPIANRGRACSCTAVAAG